MKCIGSVGELMAEIEKAVAAGVMKENPFPKFRVGDMSKENYSTDRIDLHRPYVDQIVLVSSKGEPMRREPDLIDVWFDSGAMPYAQVHYPFEHKEDFNEVYPADFIAEGVDQTRGWFFTLHAIATMLFDSVAFQQHHLQRTGARQERQQDVASAWATPSIRSRCSTTYGADATRWYMISNSQPWDNLKFDRGRRGRSAPQVLRHALQHLLVLRPLRQRRRIHGPRSGDSRGRSAPRSTAGSSRCSTRSCET